jgi:hypothetical protein
MNLTKDDDDYFLQHWNPLFSDGKRNSTGLNLEGSIVKLAFVISTLGIL